MEMNVTNATSAYTSAAESYDGYTVDKDTVTRIKEEAAKAKESNTGKPSEEFLKQQAAIFERSDVQALFNRYSKEPLTGIKTLGDNLFRGYEEKQGYGTHNHAYRALYSMSTSDRADFYQKAYAELYDEIERGYADGTRKKMVADNGVKRLATKEEELAALDKRYAEISQGLAFKRSMELDKELIAQGKKELPPHSWNKKYEAMAEAYKVTQPQSAASEDVKEFVRSIDSKDPKEIEAKSLDFTNMLSRNMMDFSALFKQSYAQAQPGKFDMEAFFANVSQLKK